MSSIGGYDRCIKIPVVKSGLFENRVYQNRGMSSAKGAGFRSYGDITGWILEKLGFAEKLQWKVDEKTDSKYVNKRSFFEWTIRVNENKTKTNEVNFKNAMNESYKHHKKKGYKLNLLNKVKELFKKSVREGKDAYQLQKSIFEAMAPSKKQGEKSITIVKTLIDFLNKNEFYKEEGIFRKSGSESGLEELEKSLSKNPEYIIPDSTNVNVVAKALQRKFKQLKMFNDVKNDFLKENFEGVVNNLSKDYKKLLKQLLTIFDKVLKHKDTNKMTEPNLAIV